MRVRLSPELFVADECSEQLGDLIREFVRGRHFWLLDPADVEAAVGYCHRNLGRPGIGAAELARKASVSQAWTPLGSSQPTVDVTKETLDDDVHDLRQPAYLIVEDMHSDRCFLIGVAHAFGAHDLVAAIGERRLEIQHSGGTGRLKMVCHEALDHFKRNFRVAVLLDSDRLRPEAVTKSHRIAEELNNAGAWVHVLQLREVENYVPNRVLAALRPHRTTSRRLQALKQLTSRQRGCFDMKKGFPRKADLTSRHGDLYGDLSQEILQKLSEGFGEGLTELLRQRAEAGTVTLADFESVGDGVVDELRDLLTILRTII